MRTLTDQEFFILPDICILEGEVPTMDGGGGSREIRLSIMPDGMCAVMTRLYLRSHETGRLNRTTGTWQNWVLTAKQFEELLSGGVVEGSLWEFWCQRYVSPSRIARKTKKAAKKPLVSLTVNERRRLYQLYK